MTHAKTRLVFAMPEDVSDAHVLAASSAYFGRGVRTDVDFDSSNTPYTSSGMGNSIVVG